MLLVHYLEEGHSKSAIARPIRAGELDRELDEERGALRGAPRGGDARRTRARHLLPTVGFSPGADKTHRGRLVSP